MHLLSTVSTHQLLNFVRKWGGKSNRLSLPAEPAFDWDAFMCPGTRVSEVSLNRTSYNIWFTLLFNWKQYSQYWWWTRTYFRCRNKAKTNQLCFSQGLQKHWEPGARDDKQNLHLRLRCPGCPLHLVFLTKTRQCPQRLSKTRQQAQNGVAYHKPHISKPRETASGLPEMES